VSTAPPSPTAAGSTLLRVLRILLRLVLGVIFVWAGVVKIYDFQHGGSATQDFWQDIMNYQMVPSDVAKLMAIYLPWLEVITGVALLLGRAITGAAFICSVLMLVFMAALTTAWQRGLDISCGCFGHEDATADFPLLMTRDVVIFLCTLWLLLLETGRTCRKRSVAPVSV
jgi:putative oxidoreductase